MRIAIAARSFSGNGPNKALWPNASVTKERSMTARDAAKVCVCAITLSPIGSQCIDYWTLGLRAHWEDCSSRTSKEGVFLACHSPKNQIAENQSAKNQIARASGSLASSSGVPRLGLGWVLASSQPLIDSRGHTSAGGGHPRGGHPSGGALHAAEVKHACLRPRSLDSHRRSNRRPQALLRAP